MTNIEIYKKMLRDYRLCLYLPFMRLFYPVKHGFCYYLSASNNRHIRIKEIEELKELFDLQPKIKLIYNYWFKEGKLRPRIKLLEQAIEIYYENERKELYNNIIIVNHTNTKR